MLCYPPAAAAQDSRSVGECTSSPWPHGLKHGTASAHSRVSSATTTDRELPFQHALLAGAAEELSSRLALKPWSCVKDRKDDSSHSPACASTS